MARPGGMHPGYMTNEQQQQMAYYQNLQQQQQAGGQYPGMPVGGHVSPSAETHDTAALIDADGAPITRWVVLRGHAASNGHARILSSCLLLLL